MFAGKPVIGIVGGIGSGKSFVADLFRQLGCLVIDSDQQVRRAYELPQVKEELRRWWGDGVINPSGQVDRTAVARRVFADKSQLQRLESLIFPLIDQVRLELMQQAAGDGRVVAYLWDAPLLIEAGLSDKCDVIVFVEAPDEERLRRVEQSRGWSRQEWQRREKLQLPLDKKREVAKYMVRNTAGADEIRNQVRQVLSRIVPGIFDSTPNNRLRME